MDKYSVVYTYQEMEHRNKKEWTTDICSNSDELETKYEE